MKSDGIKRSVRAHRYDRSTGDAPNIGRVARMPGTGMPLVKRRRRSQRGEGGWLSGEDHQKVFLKWTMLFAAVAMLLLGGVLWLWLSPKIAAKGDLAALSPVEDDSDVRVIARFSSPSEPDALAMVKRALAARDPAAIDHLFRTGSSGPQEILRFLENLESVDGKVSGYEWLGSLDANRLSIEGVQVNFEKAGVMSNRLALLTPDANGKWKIDFDAFARTATPPWKEILENRAEKAVVRVLVGKDSYFNGPFHDENQWVCLGMASPDTDALLLGYCKAGAPQAAAIDWILSKGELKFFRATLELRRVEGAEARQFEISRVLAQDWIVSDVPFDEGFR
jgi:hypothetical protein